MYCFKRCKCYFNCNATSKNTIIKSLIQFGKIGENLKLLFFYLMILWFTLTTPLTDMLLLTNKLILKCYVLYETKELLTITKMFITIINILNFIISIALVIVIIIIITITISPLVSLSHSSSFVLWVLKISFLRFRSSHRVVFRNILSWNKCKTSDKR